MDPETHGVIIGRFMPPHAGHQYLVDFGRNMCDRLTVLVCTLSSEPIPGELRYRWMQELFPDVHMVHITEEIPEASKDSPTAIPIWAETVRAHLEAPPTYVFASEDYGAPLAGELGARFVPVDPARRQFPVSATMIRENPLANWDYIPEPVRPYFLRRISVVETGSPQAPADGGGISLARRLANHYRTLFVSDYASFWEHTIGPVGAEDVALVQGAQQAVEDSLSRRASRLLFCETDPLQLAVRRGLAPGKPTAAAAEARSEHPGYDLTLLVEPPGGFDRVKASGGSGVLHTANRAPAEFLDRMQQELERAGRPYARIGSPSERELLDHAVHEVEQAINRPHEGA